MAKTNVGVMPCPCCGKDVVVKSNENDTLSCTCQWCDSSQYQRKGTMAHKLWLGRMQPLEGGDVAPVADVPNVAPVKQPARQGSGTLLG